MNKFFKTLFFLLILCTSQSLHAQDLFKGKDLSQIKVDQISEAEITKLKAQLNSSGMTIDQAEQMAVSKGMPATEAAKLKQRLTSGTNVLTPGAEKSASPRVTNSSETLDTYKEEKGKSQINPSIFGSELYTSTAPSFEPNLKLATPLNYILGPDDQVLVSVYGVQEYNGDLQVSAEGNISIPNVGQVKVAGLTVEAATQKLKNVMGNSVYSYLKTGGSKLTVTLSKIRSIKITIIGASRPGNFTISSLATVFNALFIAGGPSAFGSFREIELIRNNKAINTIDLYRFLLHGDQSDNVGLKDNDVIRIPPYKTRVELQGQVKRPGIFEVMPGEKFGDILNFASGFTDTAYRASVKVFQRDEKQRKVHDLLATNYTTYQPQSGDVFLASKILNRFQNRVTISGAVFRPDVYELTANLKVADLIRKADGLKEDAYTGRGQIIRLEEDLTRSIISFDVKKALGNDNENNQALKREDEVLISSILDLRDSFKVTIQGEIRKPGQYDYVDKLSLKDLILQAGSFTDAAYKSIEIARLIKRDSISASDNNVNRIILTEINGDDLSSPTANIILQAFDVITVRRKPGYTLPESVTVSGQVQYPGPYALGNRNEKVSDLLKRAGGYTPDAYPEGAYLKRYKNTTELQKAEILEEVVGKIQKSVKDSSNIIAKDVKRPFDQIPLDLISIAKSPGSTEDLFLRDKDEIFIPKFNGEVKTSGEVLLSTQVPYVREKTYKDYVDASGGYNKQAWRNKAYIVYANGKVARTHSFLFFRFNPVVLPGCELVIPKRVERKGLSTAEFVAIGSSLTGVAGILVVLFRK